MPAINQTITHWRGDSATITIPIKDKAGNWVNLDGATARWWMGKSVKATGSNIYIEKSTESLGGVEITNPGGGDEWDLVITLNPVDTELLKAGDWYHEAEIIDADNNVATVTTGTFTLVGTLIPDPDFVLS